MSEMTLSDLGEKMRDIDFCMFSTRAASGGIASRPMSNNREVDYDGDSHFFSYGATRKVADIERDAMVNLAFQGKAGLLGKPPVFLSVDGTAELLRDKAAFAEHWTPDLEYWKDGVDTPDMVLIRVSARRIHTGTARTRARSPCDAGGRRAQPSAAKAGAHCARIAA